MPTYVFNCECGSEFEVFQRVNERTDKHQCIKCDRLATKILTPHRVNPDYPGYQCPVTNKWIEGRRQHEENLRRHGCHVMETGERERIERIRSERDRAFDNEIGETVERQLESLSSDQLTQLGNEMEAGASVDFVRN